MNGLDWGDMKYCMKKVWKECISQGFPEKETNSMCVCVKTFIVMNWLVRSWRSVSPESAVRAGSPETEQSRRGLWRPKAARGRARSCLRRLLFSIQASGGLSEAYSHHGGQSAYSKFISLSVNLIYIHPPSWHFKLNITVKKKTKNSCF